VLVITHKAAGVRTASRRRPRCAPQLPPSAAAYLLQQLPGVSDLVWCRTSLEEGCEGLQV
jgi:hypothetical protein